MVGIFTNIIEILANMLISAHMLIIISYLWVDFWGGSYNDWAKNEKQDHQINDDDILDDNVFEKAWRITEFSKLVGRHHNTVYNWFNILEEKGLHETLRTQNTNEKLYNALDLEIALFIKQKRDEKWSLDAIIDLLPHQFDLRPVSPEHQTNEVSTELNLQATAEIIEKMVTKQLEEKNKTYWISLWREGRKYIKAITTTRRCRNAKIASTPR